jgi:cytochrome c553
MKIVSLRLGFSMAILAITFAGVVRADSRGTAPLSRGSFQAKIQYCYDCHGSSGRGYRGYFPMPRLAGQTTEYFDNQLRAFVERRRETHIAIPMSRVHGLSPEMRSALAAHFADLNPKPFGGAQRRLVATGKAIYEEGVPNDNVPACSACHGPDAKGSGPIPRLAGQLYPYMTKELANWSKERGQSPRPDPSAVMQPIAHSLSRSQIEAVASYLSYLE